MRYLAVYIYVVVSGVAVPFSLQANDLIGREYLILAGEITAWSLLMDYHTIASLTFVVFGLFGELLRLLFHRTKRLQNVLDACVWAAAGFASASLALIDHCQVYGNTWDISEAFLAFVLPVWPVILAIAAAGAYLSTRLNKKPIGLREAAGR